MLLVTAIKNPQARILEGLQLRRGCWGVAAKM